MLSHLKVFLLVPRLTHGAIQKLPIHTHPSVVIYIDILGLKITERICDLVPSPHIVSISTMIPKGVSSDLTSMSLEILYSRKNDSVIVQIITFGSCLDWTY